MKNLKKKFHPHEPSTFLLLQIDLELPTFQQITSPPNQTQSRTLLFSSSSRERDDNDLDSVLLCKYFLPLLADFFNHSIHTHANYLFNAVRFLRVCFELKEFKWVNVQAIRSSLKLMMS